MVRGAAADLRRRMRATPRLHAAMVAPERGRARPPLGPRRSAAGARALRHPPILAQARAVARGAASRLLARHTRRRPRALATDAAGDVPPARARTNLRRRVRDRRTRDRA